MLARDSLFLVVLRHDIAWGQVYARVLPVWEGVWWTVSLETLDTDAVAVETTHHQIFLDQTNKQRMHCVTPTATARPRTQAPILRIVERRKRWTWPFCLSFIGCCSLEGRIMIRLSRYSVENTSMNRATTITTRLHWTLYTMMIYTFVIMTCVLLVGFECEQRSFNTFTGNDTNFDLITGINIAFTGTQKGILENFHHFLGR